MILQEMTVLKDPVGPFGELSPQGQLVFQPIQQNVRTTVAFLEAFDPGGWGLRGTRETDSKLEGFHSAEASEKQQTAGAQSTG